MTDYTEIKKKLEAKLTELTERAEDIEEDLTEAGDDDWSESATEAEGDEVLEKMGNMTVNTISQIKLALSKIDAGTYGKCTQCGVPIASKRLEALPYATACIKCSEKA